MPLVPPLESAAEPASASAREFSAAGLPLGGDDPAGQQGLDLARLLIRDPAHTVLLRVAGDSMQGAGIQHGDLLVVDRAREARAGSIVVARFGGQFTLKRLCLDAGRQWLEAAHRDYPPIPLEPPAATGEHDNDAQLWGVAVHVIRRL